MEYFDFTVFIAGAKRKSEKEMTRLLERLNLKEGSNPPEKQAKHRVFSGKEIIVDGFSEKDYRTVCIGIPELEITPKSFYEKLRALAELAEDVFAASDKILFATGMYETTYYYLEGAEQLSDLTPERMRHFPLLFFRAGEEPMGMSILPFSGVSLRYNSTEQDIFANPIAILMEDEGLTFEQAVEKLERRNGSANSDSL